MTRRIINLGGGTYNKHIEGNYIEGKVKSSEPQAERTERNITSDSEVINTNGKNFTENLGGVRVNRID
jgi:hypothetical protein